MIRRSLRLRLALAGLLAISLALALAGVGLTLLFERHVYRTLTDDLDINLRQIVGGMEMSPGGEILLARPPPDPRYNEPLSGLYWQIDTASRALRSRSLWDFALAPPSDRLSEGETHYHQLAGPGGKLLLGAERRVEFPGEGRSHAARVLVASDLTRLRLARDAFIADLVPGLVLLLAFLACATWLQLSLGLRPLGRLRREVAEATCGGGRLSLDAPSEVLPLVREVNALLDAQEKELERARGRAADLAHGLKTPLAALAGDARRLRESGDADVAASLEEIGESMRRHVERELARARVRASATQRSRHATPLRDVVEALIRTLRRTENGERIQFENAVPASTLAPIERMDLTELIGNLLDNAARHAETRVRVSCDEGEGQLRVMIEDDGPGLDPAQEAKVRQRGKRFDNGGAAGLGLAIAQDILDAYGWSMEFSPSPLGGLRVRLGAVSGA